MKCDDKRDENDYIMILKRVMTHHHENVLSAKHSGLATEKTVEIGNWWKSVTGDEQAQSSSPDWKGSSFDFQSINFDWNPIYGQNLTSSQYWLKKEIIFNIC